MKKVIIVTLILALSSCAASRKVTKTSADTKLEIKSSYIDTSQKSATLEFILNSVVKEIDLTKIKITTYYTEKDSTGKQLIKEQITIDKNTTTTTSTNSKEMKTDQENKAIRADTSLTGNSTTKTEITQTKGSSKFKLYLGFVLIIIVAGALIYLKYRNPIRTIFKRVFK
jgi:hypothetical protein